MACGGLRVYEAAHRKLLRRPAFLGNVLLLLDRYPSLRRAAFEALALEPPVLEKLLRQHAEIRI